MKGRPLDLTGQRFGRLVVQGLQTATPSGRIWEVRCDCGTVKTARTSKLRNGEVVSCGCYRLERMLEHVESHRVRVVAGKKVCHKCRRDLPVDQFSLSAKTGCGLQGSCKRCSAAYRVSSIHNLDFEQALHLVDARASGGCEVCGGLDDTHIDHNHATGEVRGLLCGQCNRALGLLKEDQTRIQALLAYVQRWTPERMR